MFKITCINLLVMLLFNVLITFIYKPFNNKLFNNISNRVVLLKTSLIYKNNNDLLF